MKASEASLAQIELIKACISAAQEKGTMACRDEDGKDSWGKYEFEDSGLRVDSTLFFYAPVVGFFTLRVEENGCLVFAASGCMDILTVSAAQVFEHIPGQWEDKMFSR